MDSHERCVPLVSIGIPTYNRADSYLKEALESALAQNYDNLEIIVSDNQSTDDTEAVVQSYADPGIRYFRQENAISPNDNFNFCLEQARGDYFLLLHDDDKIDGDFVQTCLEAADYNSDFGLIRTGTRIIGSSGEVVNTRPNGACGLSTEDFFIAWFEDRTALFLCSTLFNTKGLKEIGGFHSKTNLFQDVVAEVKLAAKYGRVDVEKPLASFRKHGGEITFAAGVDAWYEDAIFLLDVVCDVSTEKKDEIREKGARFFSNLIDRRIRSVRPLWKRFAVYLTFRGRLRRLSSVA